MGKSIFFDLGYIEASIEELKSYILSDKLFWSLSGYPSPTAQPFPKLTLGGLLLALARSRSRADSLEDTGHVEMLARKIEIFSTKWRVAWEGKAAREYHSRLRQWGNFLNELQHDPQEHAVYYRYEVRLRVIVELLRSQIGDIQDQELDYLDKLDRRLRAQFVPGDFIWDAELRGGFPETEFWFLWGRLSVYSS